MTADLLDFLRARLDDDERTARAIDDKQEDSGWGITTGPSFMPPYELATKFVITPHIAAMVHEREAAEHIVRHDPARVLREVAAKRAILDRATWAHKIAYDNQDAPRDFTDASDRGYRLGQWHGYKAALTALVAVYSDHADYRIEWGE